MPGPLKTLQVKPRRRRRLLSFSSGKVLEMLVHLVQSQLKLTTVDHRASFVHDVGSNTKATLQEGLDFQSCAIYRAYGNHLVSFLGVNLEYS